MVDRTSVQRLTEALELWLLHKERPDVSHDEFLAQHADLRELLEPMVREAMPAAAGGPAPEQQLGDYRLVREIGRGGMGIVYEAVQQSLGRRVAVKVLAAPLASAPQVVARFRRESELLARLSHAHIVPVFEAGLADGIPFHAMELVAGCTLADVLRAVSSRRDRPLDGHSLADAQRRVLGEPAAGGQLEGSSHVDAAVRCVLSIADALAAAHAQGILHRDVKPANVLLRRDGTVLLSDFGLARDANDPNLTRSGDFAGTPYYVSPEQIAGDPARVDQRTDVFSLAVVLYELLLLERPFDGDTTDVVLERVRLAEPKALRRRGAGLSEDLACVLDKALQKERERRYATMGEFAGELRCVLERRPVRARRRGRLSRLLQTAQRQPLRAALAATLALGVPIVAGLSFYIWWQQPRIAVGATSELLPKAEHLLESMLLHQDFDEPGFGLEQARDALALLPDLPEARAAMVDAAWRAGDVESSRRHLELLRELVPDAAAQFGPQWRSLEPVSALGWFLRGMRLLDEGHANGDMDVYRNAAYALRRAMDRAEAPRALFHCQCLHALAHLRDAAAIRDLAADTRHLWPDSPFAAYWRGFALQGVEPEQARRELERASELAPELPQPYTRLAKIYEFERRYDEARALYERAAACPGDWSIAHVGLSRVLLALGDKVRALAEADVAVGQGKAYYMSHVARAAALAALGHADDARAEYDCAVACGPRSATPLVGRAEFLLAAGKSAEALADAAAACALDPGNASAHSVMGIALLNENRPEEAAVQLEQVVATWPERAHGWKALAQARRRAGDLEGADAAVEALLKVAPADPSGFRELGKLRQAQQQRPAAEAAFRRALELAPEDGETCINLAGLRWQAGDLQEALDLLATARRSAPNLTQGWLSAIRLLEQQRRMAEAIALRADFCATRPDDRKARVDLLRAILRQPAQPNQRDLLRRCLDELEALPDERAADTELRTQALVRIDALGH
ncbi:MAG TPA: protein kinase [Planctomycetota bacterium]|nr:protein kinase [Planctomycetota bacterium]